MLFLTIKMKIGELEKKSTLILGFGREGKDSFLFLRKLFPKKPIGIADKKELRIENKELRMDKKIRWHLGKNYLKALKNYDVTIKSPGIPFKILPKAVLKKIITQTDIFFQNCPGTIIGITGTKGKSTTSALIAAILKAGGKRTHLVGNIGNPALGLLKAATKEDFYVYELSSHQLYNLRKSPKVAVFLNIFREHLDYYRSFKEYARAKANITLHQNKDDYLIYNKNDRMVYGFAKKSRAKKIPIPTNYGFLTNLRIKKEVPRLNIMAAATVGKILKIPEKNIIKGLRNSKTLPHRLELVGTYKGITFYNDALSTIPETAIFAIRSLGRRVETVFLGGFDRNIDFRSLAKEISKNKNIKNLILFPTTGKKIWKAVLLESSGRGVPNHFFADNMKDAVKLAYKITGKGKICLLSTASTSFSIFKDYREKGNLFKKFVKSYGVKKN